MNLSVCFSSLLKILAANDLLKIFSKLGMGHASDLGLTFS